MDQHRQISTKFDQSGPIWAISNNCNLFGQKRGVGAERPSATSPSATRPLATRPSYYKRGALKTRGGYRASIARAWSRCLDAWTRQLPHFLFIFFLDKSRNLLKFVSVLLSASVERVGVTRMRDFFTESCFMCNV